jgi:hypothetical protein
MDRRCRAKPGAIELEVGDTITHQDVYDCNPTIIARRERLDSEMVRQSRPQNVEADKTHDNGQLELSPQNVIPVCVRGHAQPTKGSGVAEFSSASGLAQMTGPDFVHRQQTLAASTS